MSLGSGGTQTQTTEPWSGLQPYLLGQDAQPATQGHYATDSSGNDQWVPGTPAQDAIQGILPAAYDLFQTGGPQQYPGSTVATPSSTLTQAWDTGKAAATGALPSLASSSLAGNQFLSSPDLLNPSSNPYLAQTASAAIQPITQQLTEQILPSIRSGATQAHQFGGVRQGITENKAIRDWQTTAGNITSGIYNNAYNSGLGAIAKGLALAPTTAGLQTAGSNVLQNIGTQETALSQANLQDLINKWNYDQNLPWANLQSYENLINPYSQGTGTVTQTSQQNPLTSLLQTGLGGYGLYSLLAGTPIGAGAAAAGTVAPLLL